MFLFLTIFFIVFFHSFSSKSMREGERIGPHDHTGSKIPPSVFYQPCPGSSGFGLQKIGLSACLYSKAVFYMVNMGEKIVSARWKPWEIHIRLGCQFFILTHHFLQHKAWYNINRFLSGLAIHQTCKCLNVIAHICWYGTLIPKFSSIKDLIVT